MCELPSERNKMATGLDRPFNFCVVHVHGEVTSYRRHPLDLMSKVIDTHCQARDLYQDPQFFYYRNECILPTERADQIRLGAGWEIWHIFMLNFYKPEEMYDMGCRPIRSNGAWGLYSKENMAVMISGLAKRDNLTTVVEDGLVPFERVRVRDSHEFYFFHGCNLYEMDHLEVQEEELLLEVEVVHHSSVALKKWMFREQHALMVVDTFFHVSLFRMLILGLSEYLTTQLDSPLRNFVRVMLFKRCLDLMTTGLDSVVTPGHLDLLKNIFGVDLMHNLWIAQKVVHCFGGRYNFLEDQLVCAEVHVKSLVHSIHDNTMVDLGNAVCTICFDLLSTDLIRIAACSQAYH
jgi:hypothetical protein